MMVDRRVDEAGRVISPESKILEYKRDLSSPDRVLQAVVAFANSAGGEVVIGVADDGEVVGVTDPLAEQERLANLISDSVRPQLVPTIELVPMADRTVLVAKVWLGQQRPYYLARVGPHRGTYIRIGASNRRASAGMVAELRRDARGESFDEMVAGRAKLSDLDTAYLSKVLHRDIDERALFTLGARR
ncbi:MAG: ATP-binding protein [Propionibacteriaceae bacterium]|jgi:predicted HTH transcriptional regulator|nr:ATP-binding protein [Propionibacteriaceae bacterium]